MPSTFLPGASVGYNGNTGAQAHWDESSGMWIDSNGEKIRDDAIRSAPPSSPTQTATSSAPAPVTAPPSGTSTVPTQAMAGLQSATGSVSSGGAGADALTNLLPVGPSTLRQGIGQRQSSPLAGLASAGLNKAY